MADLYSMLLGGLGGEQDFQAEDPFFNSGRAMAGLKFQPQTNSQALWMPALQGLLAGGFTGYGKENAAETMYDTYRKSPLFAQLAGNDNPYAEQYSTEDRPPNWTPKGAQSDVIMAALSAQNMQAEKLKKAELQQQLAVKGLNLDPITGAVKPIPGFTEAEAAAAGAKKKAELGAEGPLKDMPTTMIDKLADSKGVIDEARSIAKDLDESGESWGSLKLKQNFAGMDESGIASRMSNLMDKLKRARTGASASASENKTYDALLGGSLTTSPKQAANLLRKLADSEARFAGSQIDTVRAIKEMGPDSKSIFNAPAAGGGSSSSGSIPAGAVPTGKTSGGKPVYSVNGKLWVSD